MMELNIYLQTSCPARSIICKTNLSPQTGGKIMSQSWQIAIQQECEAKKGGAIAAI
jgi:hypothetical protein